MCIAGVAIGLYAGIWWAFIGGIVQVIDQIKATETDSIMVAFGLARVVFCVAIGSIAALVLILPGAKLVGWIEDSSQKGPWS